MQTQPRIVSDDKILGGKLIVKGTRISVEFILELIASGMSMKEIMAEYPQLALKDVQAALACARRAVSKEAIVPLQLVR